MRMSVMFLERYQLSRFVTALLPASLRRGAFAVHPFIGYLDPPVRSGSHVRISGWLVSQVARIRELQVHYGDESWRLNYGLPSPDIAERLSMRWNSLEARFHGSVP